MSRAQFATISVLLALLLACEALRTFAPNRIAPTYEYRIDDIRDLKFQQEMDHHGEAGWELVFARRAVGEDKEAGYEVIFKRPK